MTTVVDASALARLFLAQRGADSVRVWFREAIARGETLAAPHLLLYELGKVVLRETRTASPADQATVLADALSSVQLSDPPADATFAACRRHGLTFADAAYLVLAAGARAELVTFDAELAAAARTEGLPVRVFD